MEVGKTSKKKSGDKKKTDFHGEPKSGRVGRLDEHTLGYYRRVSDTIKDGFENEEEKELMVANVFTQLSEEALKVSQNQTVSTIVELLLKEATEEQLTAFMVALSADWETACTDRFAGYVVQTLLHRIAPFIRDSKEDESPKALFLALYGFLMGNIAVFMQDTYASHVLRVVVEVLGGCQVSEKVIRSKLARSRQQEGKEKAAVKQASLPADFKEYLKSLAKKIFTMKRLKDHAENYLSNPVLQTVLLVLAKSAPKLCPEMCQLLIANTEMFAPGVNNGLPTMLVHEVGSHLVEQLLAVCPAALYGTLLDTHLAKQLLPMALHRVSNYILQSLITNTHTPQQFETLFDELSVNLEDIMAHNHIGIITHLAETCVKHGTRQQELIKALMKAFHCETPVERQLKFLPLVASFTTYDIFYKIKDDMSGDEEDSDDDAEEDESMPTLPQLREVNLHGSLLLQKLLTFSNPRPVVTSLLDLRSAELRVLACDKSGTHIMEAFLNSQTIGEKQRDKIYNKLQGLYLDLACDRGGSRVIDALWAGATMKQKELVAKELSKQENKLRGDRYGHFVWRNLAIGHYVRRHKDWQEIQNGSIRKRQLFQGILSNNQPEQAGKKQKSSNADVDAAAKKMRLEDSDDEEKDKDDAERINISTTQMDGDGEGVTKRKKKKKKKDKIKEEIATPKKVKNKKRKNKQTLEETEVTQGKKIKAEVSEAMVESSEPHKKKAKKKKHILDK